MAKLTESYLRNMIKQVLNEMYDDMDDDSPIVDLDEVDSQGMLEGNTLADVADYLQVGEEHVIEALKSYEGNDGNRYHVVNGRIVPLGLAESRKRKLAPKRR